MPIPDLQSDFQPVSPAASESLLSTLERVALERNPDRRAGIFGPQSISWRIHRESALFLGAGRAAMLQLAHPWVSTALVHHSSVMDRPIVRFHNTFRIVFALIFGSLDQALAASRSLYSLHSRIQGTLPGGSPYQANEIAALRWVYATLIETAVLAYEAVLPPLTAAELEEYYTASKTLAALFGLPPEALPADWPAFLSYCREMEQSPSLGVTVQARSMAHNLLAGTNAWIKPPHWYRALTTDWLPERLRHEFALPYTADDQQSLTQARKVLPRIYPHLPAAVRFVGPYYEANSRLSGRSIGPLTQTSNRFWIGSTHLPFAH